MKLKLQRLQMWRHVLSLPRVARGQITTSPRCHVQHVICREEEQEAHLLVIQSPRQHSRQLTCYTHQRSRSDWRDQDDRSHHQHRDTEAEWREWLRTFRYPQYPHCAVEALGWGTGLILGIQFSQIWHGKLTRKESEEEKSCFMKYFHSFSLSLPQIYAGLAYAQSSSLRYIFPASSHQSILGSEALSITEVSSPSEQDSDGRHHNYTSSEQQRIYDPEDDLGLLFGDKSAYGDVAQEREISSPETSTYQQSRTSGSPRHNHEHAAQSDASDCPDDFASGWDNITTLYTNMRCNSVAQGLAVKGEHREAVLLWHAASKQGYGKAHYNLAVSYELGKGVEKDMKKAVAYYKLAAKAGHVKATYNLAIMYLQGLGGLEQDTDKAISLLEDAAENNLSQAQVDLGVLYTEEGREDLLQASALFEMAAKQNSVAGQFYLGMCYELGWGVVRNECKASDLYRKASSRGHPGALYCLAALFEHGTGGIPQNLSEAYSLYKSAAQKGYVLAEEACQRLHQTTHLGNLKRVAHRSSLTPTSSSASLSSIDSFTSNTNNMLLQRDHSIDSSSGSDRVQFSFGDSSESSDCESEATDSDVQWSRTVYNGDFNRSSWFTATQRQSVHKTCSASDLLLADNPQDAHIVACT